MASVFYGHGRVRIKREDEVRVWPRELGCCHKIATKTKRYCRFIDGNGHDKPAIRGRRLPKPSAIIEANRRVGGHARKYCIYRALFTDKAVLPHILLLLSQDLLKIVEGG